VSRLSVNVKRPRSVLSCANLASLALLCVGDQQSAVDPYIYLPPGCSLKEPVYISIGDPVYFYDPPTNTPKGKKAE
jgi:hypothetical protein